MSGARLVVTLPPHTPASQARDLAVDARRRGAELLELRTDLQPSELDPRPLASVLELIVSERGAPVPEAWARAAAWIDRDVTTASPAPTQALCSHHAHAPLSPDDAVGLWSSARVPPDAQVKHVEPLGSPLQAARLWETRRRLAERFGPKRLTVLATGPYALPFRCALSEENALDYVALSADWVAAPGQRLLDDAVRARRASGPRLGIFGTRIGHSRSPRIHRPPFDRLDLPEDAPLGELLDALRPHYRGFAITSPFKKAAAARLGGALEAVNTVVRRGDGWAGFNTDVAGAEAVLLKLGSRTVSVLGEGGVATALRTAASDQGVALHFVRRASIPREPLTGAAVWTWPDGIAAPEGLSFRDARVAVVAYGAAARRIAAEIASRGGHPLLLGARWFIAQARRQRQLWETA